MLIILGALAYSNSLSNQFVHDDNYQIVRNPYLHSDESLTRLLFSDVWGYQTPGRAGTSNYYRPLQMLAYRWIAQASGVNPSAFHWTNLVLHLMVSSTAYLMFWHLTRNYWLSLSGAILFVLHPIHTEAVDWIASLPELGCALFYFLSFWLFLSSQARALAQSEASQQKEAILAATARSGFWKSLLACRVAVFLCRVSAVQRDGVDGAYHCRSLCLHFRTWNVQDWKDRIRASLQKSWPYLVVAVGYLALRYEVLGFISKSQQVWSLSLWAQFLSILHLATQYWYKLVLPINLNAFYTFQPVLGLSDERAWIAIALLELSWVSIWYGFRRYSLASFAAAWVFLTLLPVMNIRGVGINVFTERYLYIPSWGFCLLVAWLTSQGLARISGPLRTYIAVAALALISLLYGIQTCSVIGTGKAILSSIREPPKLPRIPHRCKILSRISCELRRVI